MHTYILWVRVERKMSKQNKNKLKTKQNNNNTIKIKNFSHIASTSRVKEKRTNKDGL